MKSCIVRSSVFLALAALGASSVVAQEVPSNSRFANGQFMPLAPIPKTGEPVAPFFEGWYRNPDGTFTMSLGFFNLNREQTLDIPIGPDNFIEPAEFDGAQLTHFSAETRRDRGVFHVTVPAVWEDGPQRLVWTITANGKTSSVAGRIGWEPLQLDYGPRAMGTVSPVIRFEPDGPTGQHIQGLWSERRTATVGEPMELTLWGEEVSQRFEHDQVNTDVYLTVRWFKHQGPDPEVMFDPNRIRIEGLRR